MTGRYLDELNLRTYVNSVTGKLTAIRRKDQMIIINNEVLLPYDLLFLMAGEIFLRPVNSNKPENLFVINNAYEANNALIKLKSLNARVNFFDRKYQIYKN